MINVLALDLSSNTGFCLHDREGNAKFGDVKLPPGDDGYSGTKYHFFWDWVTFTIKTYRIEFLIVEAPAPVAMKRSGTISIMQQLGLSAISETIAAKYGLRFCRANISTVRLHFTGNGHADKVQVRDRCRNFGWYTESLDAADAIAVWDWTNHDLGQPKRPHLDVLFKPVVRI